MYDTLLFILAGTFAAATPLLLAALGETVVQRSGVLNLSIEGMMAVGAALAFIVTYETGSHLLGFLVAVFGAMALSVVFSGIVLLAVASQVATGLAVGILGLGLAAMIGESYESSLVTPLADLHIPGFAGIPVIGPILFSQDVVVYLALALALAITYVLRYTKLGLIIRSVGEDPHAAAALGYPIRLIRFCCIGFGAAMAGMAGAYASTVLNNVWAEGLIAGRGWIAVALVVFGAWRPVQVAVGAYIFGAVYLADLGIQGFGLPIPSQVLTSLPYIVTIIALAIISRDARSIRLNTPVSLCEPYRKAD